MSNHSDKARGILIARDSLVPPRLLKTRVSYEALPQPRRAESSLVSTRQRNHINNCSHGRLISQSLPVTGESIQASPVNLVPAGISESWTASK